MFGDINKQELTKSVRGSKNKIRLVTHGEHIDLEEMDNDEDFKKRIIG